MKTLLLLLTLSTATPVSTIELVYDKTCGVEILPGKDFVLHVPLDEAGATLTDKLYITGHVTFKISDPKCGVFHIKKAA